LIRAVEAAHEKGIVHRDIKLQNCFLTDKVELKLADFGLMNFFNGEKGDFLTTKCGTPGYMAPEMINGNTDY
jgi:serine/threonine protein kinase